jgi:hypothetical protein
MARTRSSRNTAFILLFGAVLAGASLVQACGSDSGNPAPSNPVDDDSGADTSVTDSGSKPDTATNPDTMAAEGGGDAVDVSWNPDSGVCFAGTPTKNIEFLNACTTADHLTWTGALPKKNADGTLPALP